MLVVLLQVCVTHSQEVRLSFISKLLCHLPHLTFPYCHLPYSIVVPLVLLIVESLPQHAVDSTMSMSSTSASGSSSSSTTGHSSTAVSPPSAAPLFRWTHKNSGSFLEEKSLNDTTSLRAEAVRFIEQAEVGSFHFMMFICSCFAIPLIGIRSLQPSRHAWAEQHSPCVLLTTFLLSLLAFVTATAC